MLNLFRLLIIYGLILVLTGCGPKNVKKNWEITRVKRGDINEIVSASGIVGTDKEQVIITPKILGTVEEIYFEEGWEVKKGQLLIKLDQRDLLKQLEQARANLTAAQIRAKQADTVVSLQPEEINSKISQAEIAYLTAEKQVEQLKIQLRAQEEQLTAKIIEAELALKTAENNLSQVKNQVPLIKSEGESGLEQAKIALDMAKLNYERQKNLYNQGFISKQEFELSESKYQQAREQYNIAEQKMESLKLQNEQALFASEHQIKQAEEALKLAQMTLEQQKSAAQKQIDVAGHQKDQAYSALVSARSLKSQIILREQDAEAVHQAVEQAKIAMEQIKDQLKNTEIKSPIEGTVIKKQVTVGQSVAPTVPVSIIANLQKLVIEALVDEGDIGKVKEKLIVNITSDNFPDETFVGKVKMISPSSSELQALQNVVKYKVVISIDNAKGILKMGMNTYNDIIVANKKNVLLIPNEALHQSSGKTIVYVPGIKEAIEKMVEIGLNDNENTEIISGLSEDDELILGGINNKR
ncbi:MAG TPA: efflux RND transporter periplasmic adaptor subunit [Candidatus Eremiobacteraeota bacterium]|nr:efflux RND transporter periplasmic adaptor subunit [Candidatus Eremiobacteraeota bacterium]